MSTPIKLTQAQYARWVQFQEDTKIKNPASHVSFLTPEKEQKILQAWYKTDKSTRATCREANCGATTLRKVLRARGLLQ